MKNKQAHLTENQPKSELEKFTIFYEHIADNRPQSRTKRNKQPPD